MANVSRSSETTFLGVGRASLEEVEICARRVLDLAADLRESQRLLGVSGDDRMPWTLAFQRLAVPYYAQSLPVEHQMGVAQAFSTAHVTMESAQTGGLAPEERNDWWRVSTYLASVAIATGELYEGDPSAATGAAVSLQDHTPAAIRVDLIAPLAHASGLDALYRSARTVVRLCSVPRSATLSEEEVEWLRKLAAGWRIVDVAADHNLSTRALYRSLAALWRKLGVSNRSQGIATAAELGLISSN